MYASPQLCWDTLCCCSHSLPLALTQSIMLPFPPWSLILERRCDIDFPVRDAHSSVSDFLHIRVPWASVLIDTYCKIKLLQQGFRDALIYEVNSKSLRVSKMQTMIAKACASLFLKSYVRSTIPVQNRICTVECKVHPLNQTVNTLFSTQNNDITNIPYWMLTNLNPNSKERR